MRRIGGEQGSGMVGGLGILLKKQCGYRTIVGDVPVIYFEEDNKVIAFSPALDLAICGDTKKQARARFIEAATIFLMKL